MKRNLWILGLLLVAAGCGQGLSSNAEKSVEEIMADAAVSNADLIRNPASAEAPKDTINVAKMTFVETEFDFGAVTEGEVVTHTYTFTNTGKVPLVITSARSTCGCTVPDWPDEPIPPGETGEIQVKFNTAGKRGNQKKPVNITANTYPALNTVNLFGVVNPQDPSTAVNTQ